MTITTSGPDQSRRAGEVIDLLLAFDPEARDRALARLIAATLHGGRTTALHRFAGTDELDRESVLIELNSVDVPMEREGWVDALGRFVLFTGGPS